MAIHKWSPFRELSGLRRDMDDLWDRFFGEERHPAKRWGELVPSIDLKEAENEFIVTAEVPGMDAKDLQISLENDILTIKGEKKAEKEEKGEKFLHVERSYGSFQRAISIPSKVTEDKISADYKGGILRVTLPKSPETKKKSIKINIG